MQVMRTGAMMVVVALWVTPSYAQESASDIMERVDRLLRGDSSHGVATMEVVTEHWERRITMELWSPARPACGRPTTNSKT